MPADVVHFAPEIHLTGTVAALLDVRQADPTYPPQQDADHTVESLKSWLHEPGSLARWVAVVDGRVAGHVLLCEPHAYLTQYLEEAGHPTDRVVEVAKLFVSPSHRREAIGKALLRTAFAYARAAERDPALAVVVTSREALRLYESEGMQDVGGFLGVHGENRVFLRKQVGMSTDRHARARADALIGLFPASVRRG